MKRCPRCKETKDNESFSKRKTSADGLNTYCKPCTSEYGADYYKKNKTQRYCKDCDTPVPDWIIRCDKCKPEYLFNKNCMRHGITSEQYREILNRQNGSCAICHGTNRLSIDHDHNCCPGNFGCAKCVRGILCTRCNFGIGTFKDDAEVMQSAVNYLST